MPPAPIEPTGRLMSQTNNNPRQGGRKPSSMDTPYQFREENHPLHRHATALVEDLFDAGLAGGNRSHKGQYVRWMLGKVRGDREGNSIPGQGAYANPYAKDSKRDPEYAGWSPDDWEGKFPAFDPSKVKKNNRSRFINQLADSKVSAPFSVSLSAPATFGSTVKEQVENIKKILLTGSYPVETEKQAVRKALDILKYKENDIVQQIRKPLQRELFTVLQQIKTNPKYKKYNILGHNPASGKPDYRIIDLSEASKEIPVFDKSVVDIVEAEQKATAKANKKQEKINKDKQFIEEQERLKKTKQEEALVDKKSIMSKWGEKYPSNDLLFLLADNGVNDAINYAKNEKGEKLTGVPYKDLYYTYPGIWTELNDYIEKEYDYDKKKKASAPAPAEDASISGHIRKIYNEQVAYFNDLQKRRDANKLGDKIPAEPYRPPYSLKQQKESLEKLNKFLTQYGATRVQQFINNYDLKNLRRLMDQIASYEVQTEVAFNYGVELPDLDYSNMSISPASKKKFEKELQDYITRNHSKIEAEAIKDIMYRPTLHFGSGRPE